MPDLSTVAQALQDFGGDPQRAEELAAALGFAPVQTPADLLGGPATPLRRFFEARTDRFGVGQIYRVGSITADGASVGMYVGVLDNWGVRSTDRDRARRRMARALVEYTSDVRTVFILVPNPLQTERVRREAEFVFPRSFVDVKRTTQTSSSLTTIRALVDLQDPTRFHRELLRDLAIEPGWSLTAISQKWQQAFSVERVTKRFYQDYARVRDELARVLIASNPNHAVIRDLTEDEARAWATRQLGRILFLWFLQAKRWLGYEDAGEGSSTYLPELWRRRAQSPDGFYKGMLTPLFFAAMARRNPGQAIRELLGYTPYLNGGLFRRNTLEDRIEEGGEVVIPDGAFDPASDVTAFGLLSSYRFTTRESTPDDQSVDPDPELLGRVFENLYQGDERHDSGTYYTPREIVHFMCRQALDGYLRNTANVDQETIDWLRRIVMEPEDGDRRLDAATEQALVTALENVRICDPAVGSGAFLLGAMQEIVQLRRGLLHAHAEYVEDEQTQIAAWKRHAIQWSLYGVDINPEAVEICQLRLWLSLVLDLWNPREVEPLPNLDFRIVAADSLVDRVGDIVFAESLGGSGQLPMRPPDVEREERNIEEWRREFEATQDNPVRLRELRENINRAYQRIVRYQVQSELVHAREEARTAEGRRNSSGGAALARAAAKAHNRVEQLAAILEALAGPFRHQKPFLWPVAFPEVFRYGGFDLVLANPPYVRQERVSPEDQRTFSSAFPSVHAGMADIFVYFYERAVQVLRPGGRFAFITSNKFFKADYGKGLRGFLAGLNLNVVIDFGHIPVFEADVMPAVIVGEKVTAADDNKYMFARLREPLKIDVVQAGARVNVEAVRDGLANLPSYLAAYGRPAVQKELKPQGWSFVSPTLAGLLERLEKSGPTFGTTVGKETYRGVLTGLNEAFVIDEPTYRRLTSESSTSSELIHHWLRGQDISRWCIRWQDLWIIFVRQGTNIAEYPAIERQLRRWKPQLEPKKYSGQPGLGRKPGSYKWYEIQDNIAYFAEFSRPKLVWKDIAYTPQFAYDTSGAYVANTCFFSSSAPKWIAPVCNSDVFDWFSSTKLFEAKDAYMRWLPSDLADVPIPSVTTQDIKRLEGFVDEASTGQDFDSLDHKANAFVMDLYGLTQEEQSELLAWKTLRQRAETVESIRRGLTEDEELDGNSAKDS